MDVLIQQSSTDLKRLLFSAGEKMQMLLTELFVMATLPSFLHPSYPGFPCCLQHFLPLHSLLICHHLLDSNMVRKACGILVPQPRMQSEPLQWKQRVLTTGRPGKSPANSFNSFIFWKRSGSKYFRLCEPPVVHHIFFFF